MKKILSIVLAVFLTGCGLNIAIRPSDVATAEYLCGDSKWVKIEVVGEWRNGERQIEVLCSDNSVRVTKYNPKSKEQ